MLGLIMRARARGASGRGIRVLSHCLNPEVKGGECIEYMCARINFLSTIEYKRDRAIIDID